MVKFEKLLESEVVREWRDAYVNYRQLKQDLKQLKDVSEKQQCSKPIHNHHLPQDHVLSSLMSPSLDFRKLKHHRWSLWSQGGLNMVIHQRTSDAFGDGEDLYETEVLGMAFEIEVQKLFFRRLDAQLNKVNKFYRCKEQDYITWASQLQKQIGPLPEKTGDSSHQRIDEVSSKDIKLGDKNDTPEWITEHDGKRAVIVMMKSEMNNSKKVLRGSFIELYQSLEHLKDYCSLNLAAFGKILKKHDKITGHNVSNVYLRAVECSYFANSDKVTKLMDKVESLFTEYFTKSNRIKAHAYLKPKQHHNNVNMMFLLGLFSGSSVSLLVIFILLFAMLHQEKLPAGSSYPQFEFRVFSTLALFSLHLYICGFNVFLWRRAHINYAVILELMPGKKLGFLDILLLSTVFTTIMFSGVAVHLVFYDSAAKISVLPLTIMLVFFCLLLILPIDICYKSVRFTFLCRLWHIICSPLYQVTFSDFFIADQFTSQITAFQNLAWILCYYTCRQLKMQNSVACKQNLLFEDFVYFVSILPYWWRLMQCLRSWLDDGDQLHVANGGKYLSSLVAIVTRVSFKNNDTQKWMAVFIASSTFATFYQLYWDIVMDWGLLQPKSLNPWLRDMLVLKQRSVYFICVGINTVLRLAWLFSVLHLQDRWIEHDTVDFLFAVLEVLRRSLWNFFRLENEHFKIMAKFKVINYTTSTHIGSEAVSVV